MKMNKDNLICNSDDLEDGGRGHCFTVQEPDGGIVPAFAIRFEGECYAYINRCGHIAVRLDYLPGEFFSDDGKTIVCSTHGAEYSPLTGACLGGPCYGIGLEPLDVGHYEGQLYLTATEHQVVRAAEKPELEQ